MPSLIRFVDRRKELEALRALAERGSPSVFYLYGPEGCGKTRLMKEFIRVFDGAGLYIDSLEEDKLSEALLLSPKVRGALEAVSGLVKGYSGPLGAWLSTRIQSLLERISLKATLRGERVVIIVDDVSRALGVERLESYIKWLYELLGRLSEYFEASSVTVIATTSEGYSLERVLRHSYNIASLLWNLNRKGYEELAYQLNPPRGDVVEESWMLTGGNPRRLIEIARLFNWNIREWLKALESSLTGFASKVRYLGLAKEIMEIVDDPDIIYYEPSRRRYEAYRILLEDNLVMYTKTPTLASWSSGHLESLKPDKDLGVGAYYSWQIPAYKAILGKLLGHSTPI
ncbi:MAG: ATP-binding protein [Desulfurococcales archaeon]|nr:ATP-binding protein [Desulfurococcales archaeon]